MGCYEKKISELSKLIEDSEDIFFKKKYETELNDYTLKCLPFVREYCEFSQSTHEGEPIIDPIFKTVTRKGLQRKEIYEKYMRDVEEYQGSFKRDKSIVNRKRESMLHQEVCRNCSSRQIFQNTVKSDYVCMDCGSCENYLGEELTYQEEQELNEKMVVNCGYKKENHLNEWILQFQGRETTNIPNEVLDQLRIEFKKQKIKTVSEISREKVKVYLKKLKLTKYYEHATHITHLLNGLKPPEMSQALEERLRHMFREVQVPFVNHCPKDRNNFLSYSYVLYKFCELLGEDQYLPYFPLLKSKEKLRQQDVIWKKICGEVQWEYIPTI